MKSCEKTNVTGNALKIPGFEIEGTGGNCTGLVRKVFGVEILLTDDNLSHPDSFPCEATAWSDEEMMTEPVMGSVVRSEEELAEFIREAVQGYGSF